MERTALKGGAQHERWTLTRSTVCNIRACTQSAVDMAFLGPLASVDAMQLGHGRTCVASMSEFLSAARHKVLSAVRKVAVDHS